MRHLLALLALLLVAAPGGVRADGTTTTRTSVLRCPLTSNLACEGRTATLARASSAYYIDGDGVAQTAVQDVARHSAALGLFVEEARTNYLTNSLAVSGWTCTATMTANAESGPFATVAGGAEADLFNDNSAAASQNCAKTYSSPADTSHTIATFIRAGTATTHRIQGQCSGGTGGNHIANFSGLNNIATASCSVGTGTSCSILCRDGRPCSTGSGVTFSGGYVRLVYTIPSCGAGATSLIMRHTGGAAPTDTGTIYISHTHMQEGTFAGSACVAGGTATQCSADVASVSSTGFPVAEGAVEATVEPMGWTTPEADYFIIDTRDGTNGIAIKVDASRQLVASVGDASDTTTVTSSPLAWTAGPYRVRLEWRAGNVFLSRDGAVVASATGGTAERPTAHAATMGLGQTVAGTGQFNGWVSLVSVAR